MHRRFRPATTTALSAATASSLLVSAARGKVGLPSSSASSEWVTDLEKQLKRRDYERKRYEAYAQKPGLPKEEADKIRLVTKLMQRDEEVLELKRINALSFERVREHQRRSMLNTEERGMYIEDAINRQVLDTFGNVEYNQKQVKGHWMQARSNRYAFVGIKFFLTATMWYTIHYWYASDPNLMWIDSPSKVYFSRISSADTAFRGNTI